MKKYPKYKPSGVEWIGEIPENWEVKKLKYVAESVKTGSTPPSEEIEYFEPAEIDWFTPSDFKELRLSNSRRKISSKAIEDGKCKMYPKYSVLLIGIGATLGKLGIITEPAASNQQINAIVFDKAKMNPFFGTHFLNSFSDIIISMSSAATLAILNQTQTKDLLVLAPPISEQTQIANYLDYKTNEIETLIANKQKLIELLQEERTATINHAVTKGINPKVKLKPSGIEWLGDIPEHWEVSKIKFVASIIGRIGFRGYTIADLVPKGEGAISLSPSNVKNQTLRIDDCTYLSWAKYNESPEIQIFENDIILVKTGSTIGKVALIPKDQPEMTLNPQLVVLKDIKLDSSFMYYMMISDYLQFYFNLYSAGGSTPAISQEKINNFKIVFPSPNEQKEIVEWICEKHLKIDAVITKVTQEIELLKEYKTALISEVVTGKVDVRHEKIK